jgi:predicted O-methyltransferase YrrM
LRPQDETAADSLGQSSAARGAGTTREDYRQRVAELEAYLDLGARLGLRQGLPYVRHWSAGADFLTLLVEHVLAARPIMIVECGSGLSTLMLARCCALNGAGRVYSLEQGSAYAARSRAELARYGLEAYATVLHAPLRPYSLHGEIHTWYALAGLPQAPIDLMVIDGPPGRSAPLARYPALPLLFDRLGPAGTVFLDDAARPDEQAILARWRAEFPDLDLTQVRTGRGCAVLRRRPQSSTEAL